MSDNQEADMYSRGLEKAQKELKDKDDLIIILKMKLNGSKEKVKELEELIKEAIPWVTCVKEITEVPEYRQAIATKVLIKWLEKAEKIK